jgi:DNA polymerase-1
MVQGAAAEFFKTWAAIVRARCAPIDARIVLCLHDELLVHCRADFAEAATQIVADGVQEASQRWSGSATSIAVRFVADTRVITRWSDAK